MVGVSSFWTAIFVGGLVDDVNNGLKYCRGRCATDTDGLLLNAETKEWCRARVECERLA